MSRASTAGRPKAEGQDKGHSTPGLPMSRREGALLLPSPIFGPNKLLKFPQLQDLLDPRVLKRVTYILKTVSDCFPSTSAPQGTGWQVA